MPLPYVQPLSDGPGRYTEILVFAKCDLGASQSQGKLLSALQQTSKFPAFKFARLGVSRDEEGVQVLILDWSSKEEKERFEKDTNKPWYQITTDTSNTPVLQYHINLPGSSTTPECPYYEITFLTIPSAQQHLFATTTEKYFSSVATRVFDYAAIAVSVEDADELVIIAGYRDTEAAIIGDKSDEHQEAKKTNDALVKHWFRYRSFLKQTVAATSNSA